MQETNQSMQVVTLSLPKGGGAIQGMGESLSAIGPSGVAGFSLPLPASAGRGYAPGAILNYSSGAGSSEFGLGWQLSTMRIRRSTRKGVPTYTSQDEFLDPSGEILIPSLNDKGQPDVRQADKAQGVALGETFNVARFQPQIEGAFNRIEYWQPVLVTATKLSFWLIYASDGQVICFGKNAQAQIADSEDAAKIAEWLIEESVSPTGEHISYYYQAEDNIAVVEPESSNYPNAIAQRYLQQVCYGNRKPQAELYLWKEKPAANNWLFVLMFDYGERSAELNTPPTFSSDGKWTLRQDIFSQFHYGFAVRTRRLCRQVLMFHYLKALAGQEESSEIPALISRLLLSYDESTSGSQLIAARVAGYEADKTLCTLPPVEFDYHDFQQEKVTEWQEMPSLVGFNQSDTTNHYQLADLYGEGIPGILYQDGSSWFYRSPERAPDGGENAIIYGEPQPLPQLPALQQSGILIDINGDGCLDWLVSQSGVAGYYSSQPDKTWTRFTPLKALPVEFHHPQAQLADLMGDGLADLVLIGPHSVRLYVNQREGFTAPETVMQDDNIRLPVLGSTNSELVAFSDMLGSGQQHLVRVRHNGVTCWPNLGHGRFGKPITIAGFNIDPLMFNIEQIYLADLDGSGASDLIYAQKDKLLIYFNQSGNQFAEPMTLPLSKGVYYDRTCQLTIADIQGLGTASIVLSIPHMQPHHWRYDFTSQKPYLLSDVNNNMGANSQIVYRSSAQFWLDEKAQAAEKGETLTSRLPFPVHLVAHSHSFDEITGNHLSQSAVYYHGVYDGVQREFRGFGRLDITDTNQFAEGNASIVSAPTLNRSWYHTGQIGDEDRYQSEYWSGDPQAYPLGAVRTTSFDKTKQMDVELTSLTDNDKYWLWRALKGMTLRNEIYGLDETTLQDIPYQVSKSRCQVRQVQVAQREKSSPIALPIVLESLSYAYERIPADPLCQQQIVLVNDEFGFALHQAAISYPRRKKTAINPYPDSLPATSWASSYDEQQNILRISEIRQKPHHLTEIETWRLGLPSQGRSNVVDHKADSVPANGLTTELLLKEDGLLGKSVARILASQQQVFYTAGNAETVIEQPTLQALVAYSEIAEFDDDALTAFDGVLDGTAREEQLKTAGYLKAKRLWSQEKETDVWVARLGYTDYGDSTQFYRPLGQQASLLSDKITLTWDKQICVVTKTENSLTHATSAKYDYRFLAPNHITDINDNVSVVVFDALGRPTSSRYWGTEEGKKVGFPTQEEQPFVLPKTVDDAIAITTPIPVAGFNLYLPESWMTKIASAQLDALVQDNKLNDLQRTHAITEDGYLCAIGQRRWQRRLAKHSNELRVIDASTVQPPHSFSAISDSYFDDKKQRLQQQVTFSDGFGRALQNSVRVEAGGAYHRLNDGSLQQQNNLAVTGDAVTRWAVSGKVEYDNKGSPIRVYQPYFLDDWQYVTDASAREDIFADSQIYDAVGRIKTVITAKGFERRTQCYPWFVMQEDENDTADSLSFTVH